VKLFVLFTEIQAPTDNMKIVFCIALFMCVTTLHSTQALDISWLKEEAQKFYEKNSARVLAEVNVLKDENLGTVLKKKAELEDALNGKSKAAVDQLEPSLKSLSLEIPSVINAIKAKINAAAANGKKVKEGKQIQVELDTISSCSSKAFADIAAPFGEIAKAIQAKVAKSLKG